MDGPSPSMVISREEIFAVLPKPRSKMEFITYCKESRLPATVLAQRKWQGRLDSKSILPLINKKLAQYCPWFGKLRCGNLSGVPPKLTLCRAFTVLPRRLPRHTVLVCSSCVRRLMVEAFNAALPWSVHTLPLECYLAAAAHAARAKIVDHNRAQLTKDKDSRITFALQALSEHLIEERKELMKRCQAAIRVCGKRDGETIQTLFSADFTRYVDRLDGIALSSFEPPPSMEECKDRLLRESSKGKEEESP